MSKPGAPIHDGGIDQGDGPSPANVDEPWDGGQGQTCGSELTGERAKRALTALLKDGESVIAAHISKFGVEHVVDGTSRQVEGPVCLALTDQRILFVDLETVEAEGNKDEPDAEALPLSDLGATVVHQYPPVLELVTTDLVAVRIPLPFSALEREPEVVPHLRWLGEVRGRVLATAADVEATATEIRAHARGGEYQRALAKYARARRAVDMVIDDIQRVEPISDAELAPGLTELERSLEEAGARIHAKRTLDRLDFAEELVRSGAFEQARKVLAEVRHERAHAAKHAEEVKRPNAFQFGAERELETDLEELDWEIETVASEPVRMAHEARAAADAAVEPAERVAHLEDAFEYFRALLPAEWHDEETAFGGDPEAMETELLEVGTALVRAHRDRAGDLVPCPTDANQSADDVAEAIERLERAKEFAGVFAPDQVENIDRTLSELEADR